METLIVGYDGSEQAQSALRWAFAEGDLRGWPVRVVQSWRDPALALSPIGAAFSDSTTERRRVEVHLIETIEQLGAVHPNVKVTNEWTNDRPVPAIIGAAEEDDIIVVGARGRGGFLGLDLGSVSSQLAREASCPVIVVRGPDDPPEGPVVVGIDGSDTARRALRWAADEAALRGTPLHVVMAWTYLMPEGIDGKETFRPSYSREQALAVVRAIVERELGTDTTATLFSPCDLASDALLQHASGAQLLVVGAHASRHRGPFGLGSVSQQVVRHATCPVAVVRDGAAT